MAGWHHQLDGHQFEQAPGDDDVQGSLVCCSPWGHEESGVTEHAPWVRFPLLAPTHSTDVAFEVISEAGPADLSSPRHHWVGFLYILHFRFGYTHPMSKFAWSTSSYSTVISGTHPSCSQFLARGQSSSLNVQWMNESGVVSRSCLPSLHHHLFSGGAMGVVKKKKHVLIIM